MMFVMNSQSNLTNIFLEEEDIVTEMKLGTDKAFLKHNNKMICYIVFALNIFYISLKLFQILILCFALIQATLLTAR